MSYSTNAEFWNTEKPKLVGHIISRQPAVDLLGDIEDKLIWEAGCGTGFVARMLTLGGANVIGTDISQEMLDIARAKDCTNIEYQLGDIRQTVFPKNAFEGIIIAGVLIHFTENDIAAFYAEAARVSRGGSPLVVAFSHPSMYYPTSPARTEEPCWVKYTMLEDKPFGESQQFREDYFSVHGEKFTSTVWYHPIEKYIIPAQAAGFRFDKTEEIMFPQKLCSDKFGQRHGYPAYMHLKFHKL